MLDAELAILSIIGEAPTAGRTGRDVEQIIDERNMRLWVLIGVESIYYILDKLEQQGLIHKMDSEPPAEKQWRVYHITAAGIGILQTAVTDLLSSYRYLPGRFDIGLVNIPALRTEQVKMALLNYKDSLHARLESIEKQLTALRKEDTPFYIISMFEHQQAILKAEIDWFKDWYPQWESQAPILESPFQPPAEVPREEQVILPHDPDSFHKSPTKRHQERVSDTTDDIIEFPPPPQKREKPASTLPETRISEPTPPRPYKRKEE